MSTTVSIIVQPPYPLSDDEGRPLLSGCGVYKVRVTDLIQKYIDLGFITIVPEAEQPTEVVEVVGADDQPAKKTRTSAQKQENLDG